MKICHRCGHENGESVQVCENCGLDLNKADLAFVTLNAKPVKVEPAPDSQLEPERFPEGGQVILQFGVQPLMVSISRRLIFGRKSPESLNSVIDLTPYGAYESGVSRNHAAIQRSADGYLELTDLSSANHTWVNDQQLLPLQPYRLHDGDIVHLSSLRFIIYFVKQQDQEGG